MKNSTSIPINSRFEIRSDTYGWILVEHVPKNANHHMTKKAGTKEVYHFYGSVEQCCRAILSESGKGDVESARELINEWQRAVESVKETFQ